MKKTKIVAVLLVGMLCISMFMGVAYAKNSPLLGDADLDNKVSVIDATIIQQFKASLVPLDENANVDVDDDGSVTVIDATLIQQFVANIIDKFPAQEEESVINKVNPVVDFYFSNNRKWKTCYYYVFNSKTGDSNATWPGVQFTGGTVNSYGETVYKFTADTSKYDRVIFSNGSAQTTDTPLTVCNSGYFINGIKNSKFVAAVYPYGQEKEGTIEQVNLEYSAGYNKRVTIWTPVGYDANDKSKKYSVLYMTDGQNLFGNDEHCAAYEWEVDETVLSYMQNGGDGIIVVGIDNANAKRDSELTPDIGDVVPKYNSGGFKNGTGEAYADFVVDKVIPYVDANYNTNDIRGIAGSSSGGIESFYIGMEHMDKFNYIGAISPAFLLYDKATWSTYLDKFDFSDSSKLPRVYFFNGNSKYDSLEQELYPNAVAMQGWMESKGYPAELMTTVVDNDATHNEMFWAIYFPEALAFGLGY